MTVWQNRIVGQGVKPADQFQAHPANWRRHPQVQRDAMRGVLAELGWGAVSGVGDRPRRGGVRREKEGGMSETAPAYAPDTATDTGGTWHAWRCRECGKEMWIVTDGDARIDGKAVLPGVADKPVRVMCPHCGAWNPWYQHN